MSFSKIFVLSNPGTASINPQVAASGSSVFVLWSERIPHENDGVDFFIGPLDILLRVSLDGGITFSEIINLSSSNGVSNPRQIQLFDNTLYVVWEERPPSFGKSAAPSEILFLKVYPQRNEDEIPGDLVAIDIEELLVVTNHLGNGVFHLSCPQGKWLPYIWK